MLSVTPSLYNAYYWYALKDYGDKEDFLKVLRKEKTEPTESAKAGIEFEDRVLKICEGLLAPCGDVASQIAEIVRGGIWQPWLGREYNGLWLYGRADVIKCDTIYDIKLCEKHELGKYNYSLQHHIYSYCTEISKVVYLICERKKSGEESLHFEEYNFDKYAMEEMKSKISDLLGFIEGNEEFKREYEERWKAQEKK